MARNISRITINAPKEKLWEALTSIAGVKQWQFGSDLITDWKPGSAIRFRTVWEDKVFEQWGTVLEFKPFGLIRYSLFAPRPDLEDIPENYFEMVYNLSEEAGKTNLEIVQIDERPGAVQEDPQGEENPILQSLKSYAESI